MYSSIVTDLATILAVEVSPPGQSRLEAEIIVTGERTMHADIESREWASRASWHHHIASKAPGLALSPQVCDMLSSDGLG